MKNVFIWKIHTRGWHVPDCRALLFPFNRYLESQGDLSTMLTWKSKKMLMANHSSGSSQPNHHLHEGWMHQDNKSWLSPRVIISVISMIILLEVRQECWSLSGTNNFGAHRSPPISEGLLAVSSCWGSPCCFLKLCSHEYVQCFNK